MTEQRTYPEGVTAWIDVEQPDLEAAQTFYGGLFGWAFEDAPPAWGAARYLIALLDGSPVAGLADAPEADPDSGLTPPAWSTYVAVDDADDVVRRIEGAGGRVLHGPSAAGEDGRYAVCADPTGVLFRIWEPGTRAGAQTVNAPGAWNFSDLYAEDPAASAAFYTAVFGWSVDDVGFASMIRRPGYGDHLAATIDPGIYERQASIKTPPGFADAIGWLLPAGERPPHWHVTFTVSDCDATAAAAESLGGAVLKRGDTEWTRDALVRDPQGSVFTASQFTPPT
jgi:predicted enzyme related to lactoylglutathione lyase